MSFARASGILLHPTSLPRGEGSATLVQRLMRLPIFWRLAKQGVWQVLPLGPLGFGNSPYSITSAFAGNPLLISLERLAERGWIDRVKTRFALPIGAGPVDYPAVFHQKFPLLFEAANNFLNSAPRRCPRSRFENFWRDNRVVA